MVMGTKGISSEAIFTEKERCSIQQGASTLASGSMASLREEVSESIRTVGLTMESGREVLDMERER